MTLFEAAASAPASSANLGPGFDCLAVALELRCRVKARRSTSWGVEHVGRHRPPSGSSDAVLASARAAIGSEHPLHLQVDNRIPIGSGLGSSAAAFASGAAAALRCAGRPVDREEVFAMVSDLEGHPDNAAATVFGGLVLVDPQSQVRKLPMSRTYGLLVVVPSLRFWTKESRRAVPQQYDRAMVIRSMARTSALVTGLHSGETRLLRSALGDEIHESSRNRVRPQVGELIKEALQAGAVYACWSGSGPSVLVFTRVEEAGRVAGSLGEGVGEGAQILHLDLAEQGVL